MATKKEKKEAAEAKPLSLNELNMAARKSRAARVEKEKK